MKLTPIDKAQAINNDFGTVNKKGILKPGKINFRGSIAEIGAGQEVARLFFEAFSTSKTIIKTMSAYGKGCSDAIYGKVASYISEERLTRMFDHDYKLLLTRTLTEDERPAKQKLRYFAFANTVHIDRDGWAAVRVQASGCALTEADYQHDAFEYSVHFEILAKDKAAKMRIISTLGINLIYGALLCASSDAPASESLVLSLMDNIEHTDLRIDTFEVKKLEVFVYKDMLGKLRARVKPVEKKIFGACSRNLCVELVKSSTVRCATFKRQESRAEISHRAIDNDKYLIVTRSACDTDELSLEKEMLNCAKRAIQAHLSLSDASIVTAIHMPVLNILPASANLSNQFVYIDRQNEPSIHKEERINLVRGLQTAEIGNRIERIAKENITAFVSEFSATSELIKFLRTKTRLKLSASPLLSDEIACVFRADQLVMFLINLEERYKDREALEILGSMIRRKVRLYIYPCSYSQIAVGQTSYNTPIRNAFDQVKLRNLSKTRKRRITIDSLKKTLVDKYSSLIAYLVFAKCLYKLDPNTRKFLDYPLRPQIE